MKWKRQCRTKRIFQQLNYTGCCAQTAALWQKKQLRAPLWRKGSPTCDRMHQDDSWSKAQGAQPICHGASKSSSKSSWMIRPCPSLLRSKAANFASAVCRKFSHGGPKRLHSTSTSKSQAPRWPAEPQSCKRRTPMRLCVGIHLPV